MNSGPFEIEIEVNIMTNELYEENQKIPALPCPRELGNEMNYKNNNAYRMVSHSKNYHENSNIKYDDTTNNKVDKDHGMESEGESILDIAR